MEDRRVQIDEFKSDTQPLLRQGELVARAEEKKEKRMNTGRRWSLAGNKHEPSEQ